MSRPIPPARLGLLAALFLLSGAAGLVYEVAWSKRLELTFGSTSYSIGTVLAAYMAGLGLGAWLLGRWADRPGSPARRYALLEAGIGVYGLLAPWVLDLVESIYVALHGAGGLGLKAALGLLAIVPATFLMGGTLPVLARSLVDEEGDTQRAVGLLYGINTLGAVAGAVLAGLVLVDWLGLDLTSRATGGVNLALAALAFALGPRLAKDVAEGQLQAAPAPSPDGPELRALRARIGVVATFSCGALALTMEVAWTRALGLAFGATGHAFTVMLAATLLGIGLGSLVVARAARDERAPVGQLTLALLLLAGASFTFLIGYVRLPHLCFYVAQSQALRYDEALLTYFLVATAALLPATTALGIAFPLCTQLGSPAAAQAGSGVGRLYLANTVGAILGSLLGGFVLVPLLGAQGVLRAGTFVAGSGALALALLAGRAGGWSLLQIRPAALLGGTLALSGLLAPVWDPSALDLAPTRLRSEGMPQQPGEYAQAFLRGGTVLRYAREGLNAYVTVRSQARTTVMLLGGKPDASTLGDMPTQLLCGVVPFLARPDAGRVLVVGSGSGVTARVASEFPQVDRLDLVEIEPAMIEAARDHFRSVNDGVFERENVRVVLEDARTFLLANVPDRPYDVIVSVPTNPSIAGVANLFTLEHYQNAKARLAPTGVYLQWVQLYEADDWMTRAMLRTFLEAFEHVDLFWSNPLDLLLVGSAQPLRYDPAAVAAACRGNPGLMRDLWPRLYCHAPEELFGHFLLPGPQLRPLLGDAEVLHDRLPRLEGHAARTRYTAPVPWAFLEEVEAAHARLEAPWPPGSIAPPAAPEQLRLGIARLLVGQWSEYARRRLEGLPGPEAAVLRARALPLAQRLPQLEEALSAAPEAPELLLALAEARLEAGQVEQARPLLARLSTAPGPLPAAYHLIRARMLEPRDARLAAELVAQIEQGLAATLPRLEEASLRYQLLLRLADAAPVSTRALELLERLAADEVDEEAAVALAQAYLALRRPEDCLELCARLAQVNGMAYHPFLRRLELRALDAAGEPVNEATRSLLTDFPQEAANPILWPYVRRLRGADPEAR